MPGRTVDLAHHTEPDWPTAKRARLSGGRVLGTDGSLWLYRAVELEPVADAKTADASLLPAWPLVDAFNELATMAPVRVKRRSAARGGYRRVHLLLADIPTGFRVAGRDALTDYQNTEFAHRTVKNRLLMFGVRLRAGLGSGTWRSAVDSVVDTMVNDGVPVADYDRDYAMVAAALARAGLRTPGESDFLLADSWWSTTRNPATPFVAHPGHLHVFNDIDSARAADRAGADDCADWPEIPGQHAMTFASVQQFSLGYQPATAPEARWVDALRGRDALAVSIRGLVEPAKVTREELMRRAKQYRRDVEDRVKAGKMRRAEQDELLEELLQVEAAYAQGGPPTLCEASVTVALNGMHADLARNSDRLPFTLAEMAYRQTAAIAETWIASPVLANPHLHDIPCHTLAFSGLPSLARVGDPAGALLGLTQADRQPAFVSHSRASLDNQAPGFLVVGETGSGKTLVLTYLAHQWAKAGVPQVIFDPKPQSDLTAAVLASGGRISSLDSLMSADGVLDPMRSAQDPVQAIDTVASMVGFVNPWGSRAADFNTPLLRALKTGTDAGATCTGQALQYAMQQGAPAEVLQPVLDLAESSALFRACIGMNPDAPRLRVADGITLIRVGENPLVLPDPGVPDPAMTPPQRLAVNLVRRVTAESIRALSGRDGVLHLDEAWTVLGSDGQGLVAAGRTGRSRRYRLMLYTQQCTDVSQSMRNYISQYLILPIQDPTEALAACALNRIEPTKERIEAITAPASTGGAPNWRSMRALLDPVTKEILRGSIGIYCDLDDRAIPVEIIIPPAFLAAASTNPLDVERRLRAQGRRIDASLLQTTSGR